MTPRRQPRVPVRPAARKSVTRARVARKSPARPPAAGPASLPTLRVGLGFDIHPLVNGRKLMIGGVEIPGDSGPDGHSDGDPLLHALTDALLGAAGLGDIGQHFSDSDPRWQGASSSQFVMETLRHLKHDNYEIMNLDCNIILETPKLASFIGTMRRTIAELLEIGLERVSVKAKRNEGLDSLGRAESIAAQCVVLLVKR